MDVEKFRNSPVGSLIPITGTDGRTGKPYEHFAFAPEPLPTSTPELSSATWNAIARASHALGKLEQGSQLIPNPALLRRPTLRREAQSTSALEGTYAPLEEVLAADVVEEKDRSPAVREILNYVWAAERAFDWLADGRRVTVGLLTELHASLVRETPADNADAGRIRRLQVVIGSRGGSVHEARFIPMPNGPALEAGVSDLVDWMEPSSHVDINPIVAAAMSHYQFETLHPFNDGNGRIGRLLIVVQLILEGVLSEGLLSVSPWFEARRDQYQDHLAEVSATGDWDPWVRYFAEGIEASATSTASRLRALIEVQQSFHERIRQAGSKGVIQHIADILIGAPYVTIPVLAKATGKTYQAVSNAVSKLLELGILEEASGGSTRTFVARDVYQAAF